VKIRGHIGVIILAAGGSSRLGQPKQLLRDGGESLVRRVAKTALESDCDRVVIVIGSYAEQVRRELDDLPVSIIENQDWQSGMSSSIRAGVEELLRDDLDGVVIMLCDQPLVTPELINNLLRTHREIGRPIVASTYSGTRGVPAFFSKELLTELASLIADEGARRIISKHPELVATITFAQGEIDIDTRQDHERLTQHASR
jgi:molybdenum cofactor cytidylyltransferase